MNTHNKETKKHKIKKQKTKRHTNKETIMNTQTKRQNKVSLKSLITEVESIFQGLPTNGMTDGQSEL